MPRRAAAQIRKVEPDPINRNRLVSQVINKVMEDGKKSTAERIVYDALAILGERSGKDPIEQLEAGIKALTPTLEVRSRRVGGATYQVPVEVPARRARTLAVRWLIQFSRARRERTMSQSSRTSCWTRSSSRATRTSAKTTSTGWPSPTGRSPTTAGSRTHRRAADRHRIRADRRDRHRAAGGAGRWRGRADRPRVAQATATMSGGSTVVVTLSEPIASFLNRRCPG